jgi:peptidoglycan/LPS O-acetylase OafA/YrhL
LALAISVLWAHCVILSSGVPADIAFWESPARPILRLILPMFFGLSGYLVAGSLLRVPNLGQFLWLRAIRIYPALSVEVLISAFIIGPLLTAYPLREYFLNQEFFAYILNVTGHIHYHLPGLFLHNPDPRIVNEQLWTVPFELMCYMLLSVLFLLGVVRRRWLLPVFGVFVIAAFVLFRMARHHWTLALYFGHVDGAVLLSVFLFGVSIYLYGDVLPWNKYYCVMSGVLAAFLLVIPYGQYFAAPVVAYFTVSLGLFNPRKIRLLRGADYSYGIFLYGYVIQQAVAQVLPWSHEWWLNLLISLAIVSAIAAASWHFVEKPMLKFRNVWRPARAKAVPETVTVTQG